MGGWNSKRRAPTSWALVPVATIAANASSGGFSIGELAALAPIEQVDVLRADGSRLSCVRVPFGAETAGAS